MRKLTTFILVPFLSVIVFMAPSGAFAQDVAQAVSVAPPSVPLPSINEGNGVERGLVIQWEDVAGLIRPEMRSAITRSIETDCPQLIEVLDGDVLVVDAMKVLSGSSVANLDSGLGAPVLELTLKMGLYPDRQFKVRMTAEPPRGFLSTDPVPYDGEFRVNIIEWEGLEACFAPRDQRIVDPAVMVSK